MYSFDVQVAKKTKKQNNNNKKQKKFLNDLNARHPSIKFEYEISKNATFFLDRCKNTQHPQRITWQKTDR